MCLYTKNRKPIIAIEPIRVWKRLIKTDNGYETPFRHIKVKPDETLKGLFPDKKAEENVLSLNYIVDAQGVHAYETQTEAEFCKCFDEIITEWEIPAGAKYWIGNRRSNKEIAATEMKFIKVCD